MVNCVSIDVQNTITHEAGHTLGLDHSADPSATMAASAPAGETSKRVLQPDEVAGISPSEFGLAPPRYSVSVRATGAPPFEIEFGALSSQGLAQYARVTGRSEVLLLPSFMGEQWESVMGAP